MNEMLQDILDRLTRLESRLVQLMYFLGASPYKRYDSQGRTIEPHEVEEVERG